MTSFPLHTVPDMTSLGQYYIRQAGGGGRGRGDTGIGPIYTIPPFVQRGHGIGSFMSGLFRTLRPIFWSGAKSLGREALRTGGKIMADIADNPQASVHDVISKHVSGATQNLIQKLRGGGGGGRKRKRAPSRRPRKQTAKKRARVTKRKSSSSSKRKTSRTTKRKSPSSSSNNIKRDIFA